MKFCLPFFVLALLPFTTSAQLPVKAFLEKHTARFKSIDCAGEFTECYEVYLQQPIDPKDPTRGYFNQKLYLSHRDPGRPVVLFVSGYEARRNVIKDWTEHYGTNQIFAEHRYFGSSRPAQIDYRTLSIENAAHDLHRIKEVFGRLYPAGWLVTGGSKGGLTAAAYKFFYPRDPAVALLHSTSVKDKSCDTSFFGYIDSLNREYGCAGEITRLQRTLLEKRESILPRLRAYLDQNKQPYRKLGLDAILELAVLEFPFALWQNNQGCASLTGIPSSPDSLFAVLKEGIDGWFQTDPGEEPDPFAYQAYKELGYYCYKTDHLADLLKATPQPPAAYFQPATAVQYDNTLMVKMREWLTHQGNNIIYINGAFDPYSRYLIRPARTTNSVLFLLEAKNHVQVKYTDLSRDQQKRVDGLVGQWLKR
jgi:hypothetical protein